MLSNRTQMRDDAALDRRHLRRPSRSDFRFSISYAFMTSDWSGHVSSFDTAVGGFANPERHTPLDRFHLGHVLQTRYLQFTTR